jgi:hypothetical protein
MTNTTLNKKWYEPFIYRGSFGSGKLLLRHDRNTIDWRSRLLFACSFRLHNVDLCV